MRLALEREERLTSRIPELHRDHVATLGRKHIDHRQRFLCRLLTISYQRRRPHFIDPDVDSFSREFLRRGLRVSPKKDAIRPFLSPLFSFEERNLGYDRDRGITKSYALRPHVEAVLDDIHSSPEPVPVDLRQPTDSRRTNGLPASMNGCGLQVPKLLTLPLEDLEHAIDRVQSWIGPDRHWMLLDPEKAADTNLGTALRLLRACRLWMRSAGGIPNMYSMQSHGRLGPAQGPLHLITLPSTVRWLLFNRSNLVDFDLVSCHWSILRSLARCLGVPTPTIDDYVGQKEDWHRRWAKMTRCSYPDTFKPIAASWLTGGLLSASPRTAGAKAVGHETISILRDDPATLSLYSETRQTLKKVVGEMHPASRDGKTWTFVNAVGCTLRSLKQRAPIGSLYSHILTGYEQFAIRAICQEVEGLRAIIYDGFIAPPQDVAMLGARLRRKSSESLGVTLDLRLRGDPFARTIQDREPDPWDF